ncbi:MAG: hypothetical protein ACI8TF_001310 [Paracoccaceae bacterium]|jgi:hypothetical protein
MKMIKTLTLLGAILSLSACTFGEGGSGDMTRDFGLIGSRHLSELQAGIWVDPTGCDHWIIDDGVEGYLSARLDQNGLPVCSGVAPPGYAVGEPSPDDIPDFL